MVSSFHSALSSSLNYIWPSLQAHFLKNQTKTVDASGPLRPLPVCSVLKVLHQVGAALALGTGVHLTFIWPVAPGSMVSVGT